MFYVDILQTFLKKNKREKKQSVRSAGGPVYETLLDRYDFDPLEERLTFILMISAMPHEIIQVSS